MGEFFRNNKILRKVFNYLAELVCRRELLRIKKYIGRGNKILDIGAGTCHLAKILIGKGYKVTCLDVRDISFFEEIKPVIYDGKNIPFKDKTFDVSIISYLLHHTPDPERILSEAKRVSKSIIVIEDIYNNTLQKYLTFIMDSLVNFEFLGHPHSNKDDSGWRKTFKKLGLKLADAKIKRNLRIPFLPTGKYFAKT